MSSTEWASADTSFTIIIAADPLIVCIARKISLTSSVLNVPLFSLLSDSCSNCSKNCRVSKINISSIGSCSATKSSPYPFGASRLHTNVFTGRGQNKLAALALKIIIFHVELQQNYSIPFFRFPSLSYRDKESPYKSRSCQSLKYNGTLSSTTYSINSDHSPAFFNKNFVFAIYLSTSKRNSFSSYFQIHSLFL